MPGEITVKVEETRLVLGEGAVLLAEKIVVDHPDDHEATVASFNAEKFPWITLWLYPAKDGVLNCDVCSFAPKSTGFGKPPPDFSSIRKLVLFHDNEKVSGFAESDTEFLGDIIRAKKVKRALDKVEQTLGRIHAAGRNEYLQEEHHDFIRVFHDYTQANGLELWREKIDLIFTGAELNEKT